MGTLLSVNFFSLFFIFLIMTIVSLPKPVKDAEAGNYGSVDSSDSYLVDTPFRSDTNLAARAINFLGENGRNSLVMVLLAAVLVVMLVGLLAKTNVTTGNDTTVEKLAIDLQHFGSFVEVGTHASRITVFSWPTSTVSESASAPTSDTITPIHSFEINEGLLSFIERGRSDKGKPESPSENQKSVNVDTKEVRQGVKDILEPFLKQAKNISDNSKKCYGGLQATSKDWAHQIPEIKNAVIQGVQDALRSAGFVVISSPVESAPSWMENLRRVQSTSNEKIESSLKEDAKKSAEDVKELAQGIAHNAKSRASEEGRKIAGAIRGSARKFGETKKGDDIRGEINKIKNRVASQLSSSSSSSSDSKPSAVPQQPAYQQYQNQYSQGGGQQPQQQQQQPSQYSSSGQGGTSGSIPQGVIPQGVIPAGAIPKSVIPTQQQQHSNNNGARSASHGHPQSKSQSQPHSHSHDHDQHKK